MQFKNTLLVIILLAFLACRNEQPSQKTPTRHTLTPGSVKYAKRFSISYAHELTKVYLFGNRNNFDTTATFILYKDSTFKTISKKNTWYIKVPFTKIAALSSIYAQVFYELGLLQNLVAIDNIDYITNSAIIEKQALGTLKELAKSPIIDLEQTITLKPDVLFMFGMGNPSEDMDKRLLQSGIPVAVCVDHLEESPLARAEWIKFFAAFVDKKEKADSIFNSIEKNYFYYKNLAQTTKHKPTVFSETLYSGMWYVPGGKSFMATLMKDAGATYVWEENTDIGSLPLSFEQVYVKAKGAEYWINLSSYRSKKELLASESRYIGFKAFKEGTLYNNTKTINSMGYSNYWESAMLHPDRILSDFVLIFHPELNTHIKNELYYYIRIN